MAEGQVRIVGQQAFADLAREAAASERKRSHMLLHAGHDDQVQRLVIVLQPGSYVRPHHHSLQWEVLILLRGRGDLLTFGDSGLLLGRTEMSSASPIAQIAVGTWHSFFVLEPDTAVIEVKPGPFRPNEFAGWALPEGNPNVPRFLDWIASAENGETWSEFWTSPR
jgi:cupin fold WbuC family metalloprotein